MRRLLCLLALLLASPAYTQSNTSSLETPHFKHDVMVSLMGTYPTGIGVDTEVQVDDHVRARLGLGFANANPFANTADPVGRATLLGGIGGQGLEIQGGAGFSVTNTTEYLTDPYGQYAGSRRQVAVLPHAYAGVRSVLSIGADEPGRSASAPHLSVRAGALLAARGPGERGAVVRPEIGFGFAF